MKGPLCAAVDGFSLHAGAWVQARDRENLGGFFVAVFTAEPEAAVARLRKEGVFVVPIGGPDALGLCSTRAHDVPRPVAAPARAVRRSGG